MGYQTKIREVQPGLFNFIKSRVYSLHDAQDILQNVNLILVNKESNYDENKNFKSWALKIADFQIKGYLSKSKRCKIILSPMEEGRGLESVELTNNNCPASIIEKQEKSKKLYKNMLLRKKLLSKDQLQIINLYSKGLKYKQIAETLNISMSKVSVTKSRAIQRMKT